MMFGLCVLRSILTILFSISSLFLPFTGVISHAKFEAKDPENVLLNFEVIADVHMNDQILRKLNLNMGLSDMTKSKSKIDALVVAGDITDRGETIQFENVYNILDRFDITYNYIIASGNHDCWSASGFEASRDNFIKAYNDFSGSDIEKLYFSKEVKGYTFIVLGTEKNSGVAAEFSQTQLDWVDTTLASATASGKPVFVVCHQPLNNTHGLPEIWPAGGVGKQSDELRAILKKYTNVFLISGHLHNGLNNSSDGPDKYNTVENDGTLHMINAPCFMYTQSSGNELLGSGFQFEVYSDSVVIRARNYTSSLWMTDFEYSFELQ